MAYKLFSTNDMALSKLPRHNNTLHEAQNTIIPPRNREITDAQLRFTNNFRYAERHGWTYDLNQRSRILQRTLQDTCKREYNKHWENIVKGPAEKYKDPKAFWQGIKRLQGNPHQRPIHLKKGGVKIQDDDSITHEFRETWKPIFTITPEDKAHYDINNEREALAWLQQDPENHASPHG